MSEAGDAPAGGSSIDLEVRVAGAKGQERITGIVVSESAAEQGWTAALKALGERPDVFSLRDYLESQADLFDHQAEMHGGRPAALIFQREAANMRDLTRALVGHSDFKGLSGYNRVMVGKVMDDAVSILEDIGEEAPTGAQNLQEFSSAFWRIQKESQATS